MDEKDKPEFDADYINQLFEINADRMRDFEQAVMEAYKTMTMLAAALAAARTYLEKAERDAEATPKGPG